MLVNKSKVRAYIEEKSGGKVTQVSRDFYPMLDIKILALIDRAIRRLGSHGRLTSAGLNRLSHGGKSVDQRKLKVKEAAEVLRCSCETIRRLNRRGI